MTATEWWQETRWHKSVSLVLIVDDAWIQCMFNGHTKWNSVFCEVALTCFISVSKLTTGLSTILWTDLLKFLTLIPIVISFWNRFYFWTNHHSYMREIRWAIRQSSKSTTSTIWKVYVRRSVKPHAELQFTLASTSIQCLSIFFLSRLFPNQGSKSTTLIYYIDLFCLYLLENIVAFWNGQQSKWQKYI